MVHQVSFPLAFDLRKEKDQKLNVELIKYRSGQFGKVETLALVGIRDHGNLDKMRAWRMWAAAEQAVLKPTH